MCDARADFGSLPSINEHDDDNVSIAPRSVAFSHTALIIVMMIFSGKLHISLTSVAGCARNDFHDFQRALIDASRR